MHRSALPCMIEDYLGYGAHAHHGADLQIFPLFGSIVNSRRLARSSSHIVD